MNILPRLTLRWNERTPHRRGPSSGTAAAAFIAGLVLGGGFLDPAAASTDERRLPELPPFLDLFLSFHSTRIKAQEASWWSVLGWQRGFFVLPQTEELLPAIVLIDVRKGPRAFLERAARDFAEVGYAALVVQADPPGNPAPPEDLAAPLHRPPETAIVRERVLAALDPAVRWLRSRPEISPGRLGVIAWEGGAIWALELAAAQGLQACVACDGSFPLDPSATMLSGLGRTPVLFLRGSAGTSLLDQEEFARFQAAFTDRKIEQRLIEFKQAGPGFMNRNPSGSYDSEQADRAWFEIYEYLGRHVEDALDDNIASRSGSAGARETAAPPLASIADLMRAVNAPAGVRGQLLKSLDPPPADNKAWRIAHARAAVIAETAGLLETRRPKLGSAASWKHHVAAFSRSASAVLLGTSNHDLIATHQALAQLKENCGQCHLDHR